MWGFLSFTSICLAAALACSLVLTVRLGLALVWGAAGRSRLGDAAGISVSVAMLSVLTIDGVSWVETRSGLALPPPIGAILVMLATVGSGWLYWRLAAQSPAAGQWRRSPLAWGALAAVLAACGWASFRLQTELQPREWDAPVLAARPVEMELDTHAIGISDRGREIPLFRSASNAIPRQHAFHVECHGQQRDRSSTVIARSAPDAASNCHGWVFTGGEFLLDRWGLKIILEDNGYARCSLPQTGDVVVYFDVHETPVHTGIVSTVLADGTVLVESKWGVDGRYLHRPEDQPYAATLAYYRSQRTGHQISVREAPSAIARQRLPGRRAGGA